LFARYLLEIVPRHRGRTPVIPLDEYLPAIEGKLTNWWDCGEQDHPLLALTLPVADPVPVPDTDDPERAWFDVDLATARAVAGTRNGRYLGTSVPFTVPGIGSASMVGALGAEMEYRDRRTMWARPCCPRLEDVLAITWDESSGHARTLMEMTRQVALQSHGRFYVAPFPLEGPGDIIAGMHGTENLLVAFLQQAELLHRALEHAKRLWIEAFNAVQAAIALGRNQGTVGWAGIWAPGTTFPLQEDFSFNISSEHFRRFCIPHLRDLVDAMGYAQYHLDGVPALRHLEALLEIPGLRVIQWVPDPGRQDLHEWYDLIRHVVARGKSMQVFARPDEVDDLVSAVGPRGLLVGVEAATPEEAERLLERYGD
jgi:hypothetical protein